MTHNSLLAVRQRLGQSVLFVALLSSAPFAHSKTYYINQSNQAVKAADAAYQYDSPIKQSDGNWSFKVYFAGTSQLYEKFDATAPDYNDSYIATRYWQWRKDGSLNERITCHKSPKAKDPCAQGTYEHWERYGWSEVYNYSNNKKMGWQLSYDSLKNKTADPNCKTSLSYQALMNKDKVPEAGCIDKENNRSYLKSARWVQNSKIDGPSYRFNEQGRVVELSHSKNGLNEGLAVSYYDDGTKKSEAHYHRDRLEGEYRLYDKKGHLTVLKTYRNNRLNGLLQNWHKQVLVLESHFVNGKKEGVEKQFYNDGVLKHKINWHHDKKVGLESFYANNGQITHEIKYASKDEKVLREKRWRDNGELFTVEVPVNSQYGPAYKTTTYYKNQIKELWQSVKIGRWKKERWTVVATHKVVNISQWVDGNREGEFLMYNRDGTLAAKGRYHQGHRVGPWIDNIITPSQENYDEDGKLHGLQTTTLKSGDVKTLHYIHGKKQGEYRVRDVNKVVIAKGRYENDKKTGPWIDIEDCYRGVSVCKGSYKNGKRIGKWHSFDKDGYLVYLLNYDMQGQQQGDNYQFNAQGMVSLLMRYRDGKLDGDTLYYKPDGSPQKVEHYQAGRKDNS